MTPDPVHRIRRALRRALRRFETERQDEPPYMSTWDVSVQIAVWADDLDGGYIAECLDLPGCLSQGETELEALTNLDDAIKAVMMTIIEERVEEERTAAVVRRRREKRAPATEVRERPVAMKIALGG